MTVWATKAAFCYCHVCCPPQVLQCLPPPSATAMLADPLLLLPCLLSYCQPAHLLSYCHAC